MNFLAPCTRTTTAPGSFLLSSGGAKDSRQLSQGLLEWASRLGGVHISEKHTFLYRFHAFKKSIKNHAFGEASVAAKTELSLESGANSTKT